MLDNGPWSTCYVANAAALGRTVVEPRRDGRVVGSTDMGNVSYVGAVDPPDDPGRAAGRRRSTRRSSPATPAGAEGDRAVLDGAKALAMTVADLWLDGELLRAARAEWEASRDRGPDAEPPPATRVAVAAPVRGLR